MPKRFGISVDFAFRERTIPSYSPHTMRFARIPATAKKGAYHGFPKARERMEENEIHIEKTLVRNYA